MIPQQEPQLLICRIKRKTCHKLDQVYCAWLIKWVLKREIIQLAELCLSRWWIKSGTWWYWISIWRYSLVLGQYKLELLGFRWYRVSKGLVCLYILEKVEIWSGVTDASQTDRQTTEYRATQLVSSIKHKLSHAKNRKMRTKPGNIRTLMWVTVSVWPGPVKSSFGK